MWLLLILLLVLTSPVGCDAIPTALLNGNYQLAFSWMPPVGALVVFILIRVSPDTWLIIYKNDGIAQIIQLVIGVNNLRAVSGQQIEIYPCLFQDQQKSRHKPETYNGLYQFMHALMQPNIQGHDILVLFRDDSRSPHSEKVFEYLEGVAKELHPRVEIKNLRNILLPSLMSKQFYINYKEAVYRLSKVASHRDVTHALDLVDEEEEEIQEEIRTKADELRNNMPPELLRSIADGARLGDSLANPSISKLQEELRRWHQQMVAGNLNANDVAEKFEEYVSKNRSVLSLPDDVLLKKHLVLSRRSRLAASRHTKAKATVSVVDKVDTALIQDVIGATMAILPFEQTCFNSAQIQLDDTSVTDSSMSSIYLHDEQINRDVIFKAGVVKTLLLSHISDTLKDLNSTTLARVFTDPSEAEIALVILQKNGVDILLSKSRGYDINQQINAESTRRLQLEILKSNLEEDISEAVVSVITDFLESSNNLNDDTKVTLGDIIHSFDHDMRTISRIGVRHYPAGKALKVSPDSIQSLSEISRPVLSQHYTSMQMMKTEPRVSESSSSALNEMLVSSFTQLAIADSAACFSKSDDGGGKPRAKDNSSRRVTMLESEFDSNPKRLKK